MEKLSILEKELDLKDSIDLFKRVGVRNPYLFEWLYSVYQKTRLSSVDPKHYDQLALTKTKLTIVDVLVDDVADNVKVRDKNLLFHMMNIPWANGNGIDNEYYRVTKKIWESCMEDIKTYPKYDEFADIFEFDIKQVMNAMHYSFLINANNHLNEFSENSIYGSHGTMVVLHGTLDLMCSPDFDIKELAKVRKILNKAEEMARLGNMFNTYPREILEKDTSSQIIAYALNRDMITLSDFYKLSPQEIEGRLKPLEHIFQEMVDDALEEISDTGMTTVDSKKFAEERKFIHEQFLKRSRYWED